MSREPKNDQPQIERESDLPSSKPRDGLEPDQIKPPARLPPETDARPPEIPGWSEHED
jgi:hypothetical protein